MVAQIRLVTLTLLLTLAPVTHALPKLLYNIHGYHIQDNRLRNFDAILFDDGKVIATGSRQELESRHPVTAGFDGKGATLLPGLTDAHGHILNLGLNLLRVDLRGIESLEATLQTVARYGKANPGLPWIQGRGWNQVLWASKEFPTAAQLDQLDVSQPVWLRRVDGHAGWANSKALEFAGIDKNTPDPKGGEILRDASGEPTGILVDNAMKLLESKLPPLTPLEREQAVQLALDHLAALGITSVHDAGIDEATYNLYQRLARDGLMPIRIYAMLSASEPRLERLLAKGPVLTTDDKLAIRSVKFYADGALGSRGAALLAPYSDKADSYGLLVTAPGKLEAAVTRAVKAGFQANIHAIGDRANHIALNILEDQSSQGSDPRHRIEHAQVIAPDDIPRFAALDVIASVQPTHATSDMNMASDRLGESRLAGAYAWKSLLESGAVLAAGSDFPVELANPFFGLHAAVTRQDRDNNPTGGWRPEEALNLPQALNAFTLDAAYAAHQEKVLGNLEPGKWADFILIDRDIFAEPEQQLWKAKVLQTWVAGERVFKMEPKPEQ